MNTTAWIFAAAALAVALVEWWATWARRVPIRWVTKPLSLALLIGVAVTLEPFDGSIRTWMVIGLILSLAGDIFLLGSERWFIGGLVSFLLGHIAYVIAMQQAERSIPWTIVGLLLVGAAIATIGRIVLKGVRRAGHPEMIGPVIAYLLIISAMVVSAFGTTSAWAIVGALLFYISDGTLAYNRFIDSKRIYGLTVMVTYHLGQAGLVAWLATG